MKTLIAFCLFFMVTFSWAEEGAQTPSSMLVKGEVLEVKSVDNFTYLRLRTQSGETWAAVINATASKGQLVTLENVTVMNNFESKALKKVFPTILFGSLVGAPVKTPASTVMGKSFSTQPKEKEAGVIQVAKATGSNAKTIAEIVTAADKLKDKTVLVRGKVVKYNPSIMGKNWLHIRDGSGSEAQATNDILVTTTQSAKLGDVVTVKGVVHIDKDFGAGYAYKVLIEEATLQ